MCGNLQSLAGRARGVCGGAEGGLAVGRGFRFGRVIEARFPSQPALPVLCWLTPVAKEDLQVQAPYLRSISSLQAPEMQMDRQMWSTAAHLSGSGGQVWADSHVHPCRSDPFCFLTSACSLGPENKGPSWTDSVSPLWGGDRAGLSTGQVFAVSWPLTHSENQVRQC